MLKVSELYWNILSMYSRRLKILRDVIELLRLLFSVVPLVIVGITLGVTKTEGFGNEKL